jgi:ferredoxin
MDSTRIVIPVELCDFCGTCVAVCPSDAIELKESVVAVLNDRCTRCRDCVTTCPLGVPREDPVP